MVRAPRRAGRRVRAAATVTGGPCSACTTGSSHTNARTHARPPGTTLNPYPPPQDTKYVTLPELRRMMAPDSGLLWSPWFRCARARGAPAARLPAARRLSPLSRSLSLPPSPPRLRHLPCPPPSLLPPPQDHRRQLLGALVGRPGRNAGHRQSRRRGHHPPPGHALALTRGSAGAARGGSARCIRRPLPSAAHSFRRAPPAMRCSWPLAFSPPIHSM